MSSPNTESAKPKAASVDVAPDGLAMNDGAGKEPLETFQSDELGIPGAVATDPQAIAQNVEALNEPASKTLRPTTMAIGITAVVLTAVSAFIFDGRTTAGVAVGGVLATVNFILFIRLASAFMSQKGNTAPWAVLAGVKLLGLFAFVFIVLKRGDLPALALAIGYASLPIGISLGTLKKSHPPTSPAA